jgi:hypothetical protein
MQIEQVIGSVEGDSTAQAIQLRMRSGGQNFVNVARLRVFDAQGQNPVLILDFPSNVPNGGFGSRILVASPSFLARLDTPIPPDFVITNLIPESYLAAGSLTFEDNAGVVYWRLSWGGAAYTGPNSGSTFNDANGNFGPPWPGPLPSEGTEALQFQGTAFAMSSSNAADYAITKGPSSWINNLGNQATLEPTPDNPADINGDGVVDVEDLVAVVVNWGPCAGPDEPCHPADTNEDGAVDVVDLVAVILAWS